MKGDIIIKNPSEENEFNVGDMIGTFKRITDNPLARYLLQKTLTYCEKDEAVRLESALKLYLGKKEDSCRKCKLMSKLVGYIIKKGATGFGTSENELKEAMDNEYWIRGLTSVLKGIALFGVKRPFVPGAPFQIVWNITKACNMKCIHCYESAGKRDKNELSSKEVINGLNCMAKSGVTSIAFSGGEPTIHPHILDFIKYTENSGMCSAMATNGYILADKRKSEQFIDAGLEFIQISLDGTNSNTHDSFRGVDGAWKRAVSAVENFVDAGIFVEVATTVTEHNIDEIPKMIDFVRDLGAKWFMLYNFIPTGNGTEIVDMDISPKDRSELLKAAYTENKNGKMQILSTAPQYASIAESMISKDSAVIPTHFYNPEYTNPALMQLAEFIGGCGAGRFYMGIEPNGDIYPCVFFPHKEEVKLGNLMDYDFENIWMNNNVLHQLRDKEILAGQCGECDSRHICGGCRARAYNYFDDILAPDPGCVNNEKEWKALKNRISVKEIHESHQESLILKMETK
ncbi:radical SAM protein [Methanobacterium sp.]|uniref:radical SAM protein n=1 Tax=Methanobacterium sp. TaxID=2164 RepID=UPI003C70ADF0